MKIKQNKIAILLLVLCALFVSSLKAQTFDWLRKAGGASNEVVYDNVVSKIDGANYVTGTMGGVATFTTTGTTYTLTSKGSTDMFLAKYDKQGNILWALSDGGTNIEIAYSIGLDRFDNVYVGGSFVGTITFNGTTTYTSTSNAQDAFIAKYNKDGVFQWIDILKGGGITDRVTSINVLHDSLYIAGTFGNATAGTAQKLSIDGDTVTSKGRTDLFLCKMDLSGGTYWLKNFGGGQLDNLETIFVKNNNIYLGGSFNSTVATATKLHFGISPHLAALGALDGFAAKLDLNGNGVWQKQYGGTDSDAITQIAVDDNDNVFVGGYFSGTSNFEIATYTAPNPNNLNPKPRNLIYFKLNSSGAMQWIKQGGGKLLEDVSSISLNTRGDMFVSVYYDSDTCIVAGTDTIISGGADDGFVLKVNKDDGTIESKARIYGVGYQKLDAGDIDNEGNYYGAGSFSGSSALNAYPYTVNAVGSSYSDIFITKFAPLKTTTNLSTYCAGATLSAYVYNNSKIVSGNQYHVDLSDTEGNFSSSTRLGSKTSNLTVDTVTVTLPKNLTSSNKYRIRVIASGTSTIGVATDSIRINSLPTVNAGVDVDLTTDNPSELLGGFPAASGAHSPYSYEWSPATALSATNIANPTVSAQLPSTYVLKVTDALSCVNRDTVVVNPQYTLFVDLTAFADTNMLFARVIGNQGESVVEVGTKFGVNFQYPDSGAVDSLQLKFYYDAAAEPFHIQLKINYNGTITAVEEYGLDINNEITIGSLQTSLFSLSVNKTIILTSDFFALVAIKTPKFPIYYSNDITDYNWVYAEEYGESGAVVSSAKQFYDQLGRPSQIQSVYMVNGKILAAQTVYDSYGRGALQTLPAPIQNYSANSTFDLREAQYQYKNDFIQNAQGNTYSYLDFDRDAYIKNPNAVKNNNSNTVGYFYSSNNSAEPFIDETQLPYQRSIFAADPFGSLKMSAGADNMHKIGSGKEAKIFTMVSCNEELQAIYGENTSHWVQINPSDRIESSPITTLLDESNIGDLQVAVKTVSIDADGKEHISYNNNGLAVGSAQSGLGADCQVINANVPMYWEGTKSADIHVPVTHRNTLKLVKPDFRQPVTGCPLCVCESVSLSYSIFKLTDLVNNRVLEETVDYTFGSLGEVQFTSAFNTNYPGSLFLRISFDENINRWDVAECPGFSLPTAYAQFNLDYSAWSKSYYDLAGRLRQSFQPTGIDCHLTDDAVAPVTAISSKYDYSPEGYAIAAVSPDEGLVKKVYDEEGKLRFSQNAKQLAQNSFSYIAYDKHGRAIENGEYATPGSGGVYFADYYESAAGSPNTSTILNNLNGLADTYCTDRTFIYYGNLASIEQLSSSGYTNASSYAPHYTYGAVAKTKNANSETWYSYTYAGQAEYTVQRIGDAEYAAAVSSADKKFKTLNYSYNAWDGRLLNSTYQQNDNSEKLIHHYYYNAAYQLQEVKIESQHITTPKTVAKYFYYTHGQLKRKELGTNLQGIDYVYTAAGLLKSINSASLEKTLDPGQDGVASTTNSAFAPDVFGMTIDYYSNDYSRTSTGIKSTADVNASSAGRIAAIRYKINDLNTGVNHRSNKIAIGSASERDLYAANTVATELMNQYTYDKFGQLSTAVFGLYTNNAFTALNDYKEYGNSTTLNGINYDKNGNITNLKRNSYNTGTTGATVQIIDDLAYTYTSGKNQLASIIDNAGATALTTDFEAATTKNFSYNAIGQLTASEAEGVSAITYHPNGKIKQVTYSANSRIVEYTYSDGGQKMRTKHSFNDGSGTKTRYTWYAFGGNAIYEKEDTESEVALEEISISGGGSRVGVYKPISTNSYHIQYELADHLGNVRAVISQDNTTNAPSVEFWADYYVFGGLKAGRNYSAGSYRYEAKGQENAEGQANWSNFELRMLNKDLGRWMTPDPYGQFHSPYLAMGNNPVSNVDPDGGWVSVADLDPGHPYFYSVSLKNDWNEYLRSLGGAEPSKEAIANYIYQMQQLKYRENQWSFESSYMEMQLMQKDIYWQTEASQNRFKELSKINNNAASYLNFYAGKDRAIYREHPESHRSNNQGSLPRGAKILYTGTSTELLQEMYTERLVNDIKFNVEQQVKEMYPDIALDFSVTGNNINILFNFQYLETTITKDYGNNNQLGYVTVKDASFSVNVNVGDGSYSNQSAQSNGGKGLDFNDKWGETIGGAGILADVIENAAKLADGQTGTNIVLTTGVKIAKYASKIGNVLNAYSYFSAYNNFNKSPKHMGDYAKFTVNAAAATVSFIGWQGSLVGLGIGTIDALGGFDYYYQQWNTLDYQIGITYDKK